MLILLNGFKTGIVLAFLIGPVFFTIIQTSIESGFWKGVLVAIGVSLSDAAYVIICYFGLAQFVTYPHVKIYMAYGGGGILILFGVYYLFFKSKANKNRGSETLHEKSYYKYILKGFIINGFTPTIILFWLGTVSFASVQFGYVKGIEFFLFFLSILMTVLGTDIAKAFLADKLRLLITPRSLNIMNAILGLVMIGFGLEMIFDSKVFL
jgi:threonine/homoserine/homoserine lactone efflux protein